MFALTPTTPFILRQTQTQTIAWKLAASVLFWLLSEIILNYVGLDNLADYSEFLFDRHTMVQVDQAFRCR